MILKWLLYLKAKSKQTWLLILVLCFAGLLMMQTIEDKKKHRYFATNYATDSFLSLSQVQKSASLTESDKSKHPKAEASFRLLDDVRKEIWNLSYSDDYQEMNRLLSLISILSIREDYSGSESNDEVNAIIEPLWRDVAKDVPFDSIDFTVREKGFGLVPTNLFLLMAQYHHYLYVNNLNMLFNDELSSISLIYVYLDTILPIAIIILSLFLAYNIINNPMRDGKIKLLVSSGYDRNKFYLSAWMSSLVQIVAIIVIPIILLYGVIFISGKAIEPNYPMIVQSNPLTELKAAPNYYDDSEEIGRISELYPNAVGRIPPLNDDFVYGGDIQPNTQIIPFYQFLVLALCQAVLFIAFLSAIATLMSTLIHNGILSLITSGIVFLVGFLGTSHLTKFNHLNMSPFTMFSPVRILEGIHNTTFLSSSIVLTLCTFALLLLGCKLFEHKSI